MTNATIYQDIATRTGGDIYLGVVGPVRTGKSTFIKRFMETMVIPNIDNVYMRERARDELPQSGSGRTIMTAEPKFVPEEAVIVDLGDGVKFSVRLIDCVGYMVNSAVGQYEDGVERMVTTPWYAEDIPMAEAAEKGTHKVITEHSTIGLVVTTDGTICDIPREDYVEAEDRVIRELLAIGKPFAILVNSARPNSPYAQQLAAELSQKYGVSCISLSCLELTENDISEVLRSILNEFPVAELGVYLPPWVDALPLEHPIKASMLENIRGATADMSRIKDVDGVIRALANSEGVEDARLKELQLGTGNAALVVELPRELYYQTISEQSGFDIKDDGDLMSLLSQMKGLRSEYERVSEALRDVRDKGYGVVLPSGDDLNLEEPQIVRQGGRYTVRLRASAPSIHMFKANIETEVSPALGGERVSEEIINFLLQDFEGDASRLWESNIFGKPLHDIASEGLVKKIRSLPEDAQSKLQETLQRIINESSGGLICIIL